MKILLHECLPLDFRQLSSHDTHTVQFAGWKGKNNGELLQAAEIAAYDVLLTVDQGYPTSSGPLTGGSQLSCIRCRTNQIEDLLPLVEAILQALDVIQPGQTVAVPS